MNALAIFDGSTNLGEITTVTASPSFSGLSLTATDGSSKTFSIRATFKAVVTDNFQLSLTVNAATASAGGSSFAAANAGAAASSIAGDDNRIEVIATDLEFVQQPTNVNVNTAMSPSVTVEAIDAFLNRDLDYVTDMTVSATGATFSGNNTSTPTAGIGTFNNIQFSTTGTGVILDVASGGLTNTGNSSTFDIFAPTPLSAGDIAVIGFNAGGAPDNFTILILKDLNEGTVFYVNDNEVTTLNGTTFSDLSEMEASFTVKPGQSILAGTVIVLPWGGSAVSTSSYDWSSTSGAGLNNGPNDEIYIYTSSSILDLTPSQFIYYARLGGTSQTPNGLSSGITSVVLTNSAWRYSTSGALYTGCQFDILTSIGNIGTNWNTTGATSVASGDWTFTITDPLVPTTTGSYSKTESHADGATVSYSDNCDLLAELVDQVGGNNLGSTSVSSEILSANLISANNGMNGQVYLRRNYTITPTSSGSATITFYVTQADFDAYNATNGSLLDMPASGDNSDPNIANIKLAKVTGGH